jgi:hypothetical protein
MQRITFILCLNLMKDTNFFVLVPVPFPYVYTFTYCVL